MKVHVTVRHPERLEELRRLLADSPLPLAVDRPRTVPAGHDSPRT
jgi:hypothetical protein